LPPVDPSLPQAQASEAVNNTHDAFQQDDMLHRSLVQ
jgi:hypothetical protein